MAVQGKTCCLRCRRLVLEKVLLLMALMCEMIPGIEFRKKHSPPPTPPVPITRLSGRDVLRACAAHTLTHSTFFLLASSVDRLQRTPSNCASLIGSSDPLVQEQDYTHTTSRF